MPANVGSDSNRHRATSIDNARESETEFSSNEKVIVAEENELRHGIRLATETSLHMEEQTGVRKVEAFNKVLYRSGKGGRTLMYILVLSIGLTMTAYALDQGITYQFNVIAASTFSHHAEIGAVNTASTIIRAISKPFIGKLADITSRPTTYLVVLIFYAIGFAVAASCNNIATYVVGISFTSFGKSGLDLLSDIIVGDLTPLEWRAFFGSLLSVPFLVTTFIDGFISNAFIPDKWRWGLGMFSIMIPVLLVPAIWTLYAMQSKAKIMGMVSMGDSGIARKTGSLPVEANYGRQAWSGLIEIDLAGLILLGFAFSMILLPLNLAKSALGGWSNPSMIAMLVSGFVILIIFILFEAFVAPKPLMTKRVLKNKAFLAAVGVDVFSQMASSVHGNYFSSYIYVTKDWSNYAWTIFTNSTTLGLCFFGPIGGLIHRRTHRYKILMNIGALLIFVGYAVLLTGNGRSTLNTSALSVSQVLLGFGAFSVIGARVGSQASVPHQDMATVISLLALWSTLGSSVGYSIAAAIWTDRMLPYMREDCPPGTPESVLENIYASIKDLRADYSFTDPVRQGAITAYTRTNGIIFATTLALSFLTVFFGVLMPNYYLGKQQNAITNTGLDGGAVIVPLRSEVNHGRHGLLNRVKSWYLREY